MITAEQVAGQLMTLNFTSFNEFGLRENTTNKGGGACYEMEDLKK
jgi:threonine aldolase